MRIAKALYLASVAAVVLVRTASAQDGVLVLRFYKAGDKKVAVKDGTVTIDHSIEVGETDSAGIVRVEGLEDGGHIVELVARGYQAFFDKFVSGPRVPQPIEFEVLPVAEAAKAKGQPTTLKLAGFEKRRAAAQGKFFTLAQLKAAAGRPLANFLKVDGGATIALGPKGESFAALAGQPGCFATVVRDGLRVYPFEGATPTDLDKLFTDDLAGIEYYARPTSVPADLKDAATCGALVLWSR